MAKMIAEHKRRLEFESDKSNEIISPEDHSTLAELLLEAEQDVHSIDLEIAQAQAVLDGLVVKRTTRVARVMKFRAAAPHKRMPPEIISWIFQQCLGEDHITVPLDLTTVPWNLARVCSRWRIIALTEPCLWKNVAVETWADGNATATEKVHKILSRSGDCPVSLNITDFSNKVPQIVFPYSHRLLRLTLRIFPMSIHAFLRAPAFFFPMLESLTLNICELDPTDLGPNTVTTFSTAPALRSIDIGMSSFDARVVPLHYFGFNIASFPRDQLTRLSITTIAVSPQLVLDMVLQSPQLCDIEITLGTCRSSALTAHQHKPVVAANLDCVTINSNMSINFRQFLRCITLPALQSFDAISPQFENWPQKAFMSLMRRSRCKITGFTLLNFKVPNVNLIPLMKAMPNLFDLDVRFIDPAIPVSTIQSMIQTPLLRRLEIFNMRVTSLHAALDLLENRWTVENFGKRRGIREAEISIDSHDEGFASSIERYDGLRPRFELEGRDIEIIVDEEFT